MSSLIPDNITLDKPVELADVELPATEYGTFESVSYTHLDVYKRQLSDSLAEQGMMVTEVTVNALTSVSYTHLP